ncbi:hypothetical protein COJ46_16500 [Bacillus sp. AFS077874]|nr:hypothetical protein CON00_02750 [Bacillus sp. AFS096315]PFM78645.1 hypothetical protein COJ46_16500 [Bacillus sp. AFS077874]
MKVDYNNKLQTKVISNIQKKTRRLANFKAKTETKVALLHFLNMRLRQIPFAAKIFILTNVQKRISKIQ